MKLQEEEHQRKLIQDKANQVIRHSFLFLFSYHFLPSTHYWQVVMLVLFQILYVNVKVYIFTHMLMHHFLYVIFFFLSSATDRFGSQQDPVAVSVTLPVHQPVQREEVQFKGKDLCRGGSRFVCLTRMRTLLSLFISRCLNKCDKTAAAECFSIVLVHL